MLIVYLSGCDCWQCAKGVVINAETHQLLDSVLVTSYTKSRLTEEYYTDSTGKYEVCTTNTGRCDGYLKVTFSKEGYIPQEFNDPPYTLNVEMKKQ